MTVLMVGKKKKCRNYAKDRCLYRIPPLFLISGLAMNCWKIDGHGERGNKLDRNRLDAEESERRQSRKAEGINWSKQGHGSMI